MRLREDLNLDSFDLAELTVKIEDEFDRYFRGWFGTNCRRNSK